MSYLDQSAALLKTFEGCVGWPYLDSKGNVTVGVGFLLATQIEACGYPFRMADETPATAQQIGIRWSLVKAMEPDKLPAHYLFPDTIHLDQADIDSILLEKVTELDRSLSSGFMGWATMPDAAKVALLDMAYNLGLTGVLGGYPMMCAAIRESHWNVAAMECGRNGIPASRNDWCKAQFLSVVG
jgi:GH24 family phage-related lysozyme (muramidase)